MRGLRVPRADADAGVRALDGLHPGLPLQERGQGRGVVHGLDLHAGGPRPTDELRRRPGQEQAPALDDGDVVADPLGVVEQVGGQEDGGAPAQGGDEIEDLFAPHGVEGGGRLVQNEQARGGHECPGQAEALTHAPGVGADRLVHAPQARQPQEGGGATPQRRAPQARHASGVGEDLVGPHPGAEAGDVGQVADQTGGEGPAGVAAQDPHAPAGGAGQAQDHADGRGLARAVAAQEAEDSALGDAQVQVVHDCAVLVALGQAPGGQGREDGGAHRRSSP